MCVIVCSVMLLNHYQQELALTNKQLDDMSNPVCGTSDASNSATTVPKEDQAGRRSEK